MSGFNESFLADFAIPLFRDSQPLQWVGPIPGNPVDITQFTCMEQWRLHVHGLQLRGDAPKIIRSKHEHMLRVLFLAWMDAAVIKLAELAALAALEGAIKARYPKQRFKGLEAALKHLVEHGGVTDDALPVFQQSGGVMVQNLLYTPKDRSGSGLSEIRNRLAHGDPFEVMPWAGLFEVVRDLIDFMYPSLSKKV